MIKIKRNGIVEFTCIISLVICFVLMTYTRMGVTDELTQVIWVWALLIGSGLIYCCLKQVIVDKFQFIVVYSGYLLRCALDFVDVYGRKYVTPLYSGWDTEGFYYYASALYEGNEFAFVPTKYPYILNYVFQITGNNRFCGQYVNIIF